MRANEPGSCLDEKLPGKFVDGPYQGTRTGVPLTYVYYHGTYRAYYIGILGDNNKLNTQYIGIKKRAYIGISHRGTFVGVHPTIP